MAEENRKAEKVEEKKVVENAIDRIERTIKYNEYLIGSHEFHLQKTKEIVLIEFELQKEKHEQLKEVIAKQNEMDTKQLEILKDQLENGVVVQEEEEDGGDSANTAA